MLSEAGFDFQEPNPRLAWRVFKEFVRRPVECADDGVLFECGVFTFAGDEQFWLDFTRQFSIDVDGEYDHMIQLHCTFMCVPTAELRQLHTNLWAYDFDNLDEYFAAVESLTEFQTAIVQSNWSCVLHQGTV